MNTACYSRFRLRHAAERAPCRCSSASAWNLLYTRIARTAVLLLGVVNALGQAVDVTVSLDHATLVPGLSTTCRVFAVVRPTYSNLSDRIFSWYVDLVCSNATAAQPDYANLQMPTGDNMAQVASSGQTVGSARCGIRNTFMNLPGAGVGKAVELFRVPVNASALGQTTFRVRAGTTATNMSSDFIVAPLGGGSPYTGGVYTAASATLTVQGRPAVSIRPAGAGVRLDYPVVPGLRHEMQFRDDLLSGPAWAPLAGAPHNGGSLTNTPPGATRFYRVAVTLPY